MYAKDRGYPVFFSVSAIIYSGGWVMAYKILVVDDDLAILRLIKKSTRIWKIWSSHTK